MNLKILLPYKIFLEAKNIKKIIAEAENGSFGLLPRHLDFVTSLAPGILSYTDKEDRETFVAVNGGTLVKIGPDVLVSTREAIAGPGLGQLRETVNTRFRTITESEKKARSALARLEADFVRRFSELRK